MPTLKLKQKRVESVIAAVVEAVVSLGARLRSRITGYEWKVEAIQELPKLGGEGRLYCTRGNGCGKEYQSLPPSELGLKIDGNRLIKL